jgi:asparagine synthase (glutamine-hydrolysing)
MSAICGILRFDRAAVAMRDLDRMLNTMAHRVGDRRRAWAGDQVGLGHGLLRVTREDLFEAQPLHHPEIGVTLVADLRLDNREDLARSLGIDAGSLETLPDSALLLAAYHRWGEDCAAHLLGDFAFALWDGRRRRLVLGRDHMGQRQLFYHHGDGFFAFASEIKALWALPDVPRRLGDAAVGRLLMRDLTPRGGATVFDEVLSLPGGRIMTVDTDGRAQQTSYWEPQADPAHEGRDESYYVEAYRAVLGEAVACRIRRVPTQPGLIFSGGYDSAAVAALAGAVLQPAGRKLIAVASTMPADYVGSIRHAGRWVEMCARDMPHLELHRITRAGRDPLQGFERACLALDSPVGSYHFVQDEIHERLAARGVRLVMDGHGGDYTLNPRGQGALARLLRQGRWLRFAGELGPYLRGSGYTPWAVIKNDVILALLPLGLRRLLQRFKHGTPPPWGRGTIAPALARRLMAQGEVDVAALAERSVDLTDLRGLMLRTLRRVQQAGGNIAAASHGLSLTRPFHDKRVVELALAVPPDLYVKNGRSRYLACRALADLYPPEFQTRWRLNDDQIPDFQRMIKAIEPRLLAEVARMERSEALSGMVDFDRIRALLAARGPEDHNSGWEQETQAAVTGLMIARYVEWFRRDNR